jgi:hypothetical protein
MRFLVLLALLAAYSDVCFAEGGCPDGFYPYNTPAAKQCVPIPKNSMGGGEVPQVRWESRWGAIAMDLSASESEGGFGAVTDMRSRREAEKSALLRCSQDGAKACKVSLRFENQCAVITGGADGRAYIRAAADAESTSKLAMEDCRRKTRDCVVYYTGCSLPVRVK